MKSDYGGPWKVVRMFPNGSIRITNGEPGVNIVVGFLGYVTHASPEGNTVMMRDTSSFRRTVDPETQRVRRVFTGRLEGTWRVPGRDGR
jgi:hypothetical protein